VVDMIAHEFTYDEERNKYSDFIQLMPNGKLISILSSPEYRPVNSILNFLKSFDNKVWILLILSYLAIYALNSIKVDSIKLKILIAIDYFVSLLNKGIICKNEN